MDINVIRSLVTAGAFLCFVAIVFWAYSKAAKPGFDEAAMLPFQDGDDVDAAIASRTNNRGEGS